MSKYFRPWNIDQTLLLPPNVQDFVPKGHVSRFIVELVREHRKRAVGWRDVFHRRNFTFLAADANALHDGHLPG
jgi:hypothetical protein